MIHSSVSVSGFFVLDDYSPLRQISEETLAREARERFPGEARYEAMVRRAEGAPPTPAGR